MSIYCTLPFHSNNHCVAAFLEIPMSQTVSLGEMAEFRCRHDTADFIGWKVNGSLISQANPPPDITLEFISGGSKLTIIGRLEYNGTEVVGVAIFYSSFPSEETNPPAILRGTYVQYRQGLYSRVML